MSSIKSFLAFPSNGKKDQLHEMLQQLGNCEVIPSTNHELLVVVTEVSDKKEEEQLLAKISESEYCDQISMVAGYNNNQNLQNQ